MAVRPKKALVTAPAFSEYERALGTVGAEVQYYRLKEEQDFRIQEDILEQITEDTDMIFLCNPNNPTGQTTEKELLIRVMNRCNKCGTILVLDECFIEFLEEPERYECREVSDTVSECGHYQSIYENILYAGCKTWICIV